MFAINFICRNIFHPQKHLECAKLLYEPQRYLQVTRISFYSNKSIDYSRVPLISEDDLEETFVRGSGPGGQAVNKTSNCVVLRHKPTNIVVKCHIHRVATQNRKAAREILLAKLDEKFNGEYSIENQKKRLAVQKEIKSTQKRKKLEAMKAKWKERESEFFNNKQKDN